MSAIKFKGPGPTRHGKTSFLPGVALGLEDAALVDYFVAVGWADRTDEAPIYTYASGEVECGSGNGIVDPATRQNGTGLLVHDLIQSSEVTANG